MTKVEELLSKPGVGTELVRKVIATQPGNSVSVTVGTGSERRILKATVVNQVAAKATRRDLSR